MLKFDKLTTTKGFYGFNSLLVGLGLVGQKPCTRWWLICGALLGLLTLSRENALVLVFVMVFWLLIRYRQETLARRMQWAGLVLSGLMLVLIPVALRNNPRFMLEHVALMVIDVASDYGESIERGRIVNVVEYHDSSGFLSYAAQTAARERAKGGPAQSSWTEAAAAIEEIRARVYPELLPPSRLPASISWVRARSETIRGIAARVPA